MIHDFILLDVGNVKSKRTAIQVNIFCNSFQSNTWTSQRWTGNVSSALCIAYQKVPCHQFCWRWRIRGEKNGNHKWNHNLIINVNMAFRKIWRFIFYFRSCSLNWWNLQTYRHKHSPFFHMLRIGRLKIKTYLCI